MLKNIALRPEEEIIRTLRPTGLQFFFSYLFGLLFIALSFFLLFPLTRFKIIGVAIFIFLLLFGLGMFFRALFLRFANLTIITNRRIISAQRKGLLFQVFSEVDLSKIQDISYSIKGLKQTLFRFGTIAIQTAPPREQPFIITAVKHPQEIQNLLNEFKGKS